MKTLHRPEPLIQFSPNMHCCEQSLHEDTSNLRKHFLTLYPWLVAQSSLRTWDANTQSKYGIISWTYLLSHFRLTDWRPSFSKWQNIAVAPVTWHGSKTSASAFLYFPKSFWELQQVFVPAAAKKGFAWGCCFKSQIPWNELWNVSGHVSSFWKLRAK